MPTVRIVELDREIEIPEGRLLLQGALDQGVAFGFVCAGESACATCLVKVVEGLDSLPPRNSVEDFLSKAMLLETDYRLACQTPAGSGPLVLSFPSLARKS